MRPGFFYYRRRMDRRVLARLLLFVGMTLVLATAVYATAQLRPLLESMATTRVSNTVNRIVFEAVNEAIESGEITYDQLISFEKDNDGKITAVHSNMAACNRLQVEILDIILACTSTAAWPFCCRASPRPPRSPTPSPWRRR